MHDETPIGRSRIKNLNKKFLLIKRAEVDEVG
jgi:hypothetical protein